MAEPPGERDVRGLGVTEAQGDAEREMAGEREGAGEGVPPPRARCRP